MDAFGLLESKHMQETTKDERIMALKVYDICQRQECLTHKSLGPARTATCCFGDVSTNSEIIRPPQGTVSVTVGELEIKKVYVQKKRPSSLKSGYWDLSFGVIFEYVIDFWGDNGCIISSVQANSTFNMKTTMYGSVENDTTIMTDLHCSDKNIINSAAPYILVSAKAVCLDAEIYHNPHHDCRDEVRVKIGLFSIIKMLRFEDLNIRPKGFYIPNECGENPHAHFESPFHF